jgi:hypothetical protein
LSMTHRHRRGNCRIGHSRISPSAIVNWAQIKGPQERTGRQSDRIPSFDLAGFVLQY